MIVPAPRKSWSATLSTLGGSRPGATLLRFGLGGGVNTLATLLLYWLLLRFMPSQAAYAISFLAGIVLGYLLNTAFVFNVRRSWRSFLMVPAVYAAGYLAGALVLEIATGVFRVDPYIAPLFSILVTVPLTFVLMRLVLRDPRR